MYDVIPDSDEHRQVEATLAQTQLSAMRGVPPAAVLAYRTPLEQHPLSADAKAATVLTLVGLMFTIVGRFAENVASLLRSGGWMGRAGLAMLFGFALLSFAAVVQAFRTISPRFPRVRPSLAFFGDIARLSREQYIEKVEKLSSSESLEEMLLYNHTASIIIVAKMRQLRWTFWLFEAALAFWIALLALIAWRALWN